MSLNNYSIDISPDEGFDKNDIFSYQKFGAQIANLLTNSEHALTIAIDGQWGQGKTTFMRMWAGHLRKMSFPVIEFDAFANDYYEDPFVPLAGEILELSKKDADFLDEIKPKILKVGASLSKAAVKLIIKAVTVGVLDESALKNISEDIANDLSEYAEKQVENLIENHQKGKGEIEALKDAISKLPNKLQSGVQYEDGAAINAKPLVFIIDELDRCRPDYALKLLERVKHFFSVPNIHFVFVVHLDQLENSVKAAYGADIDATKYLQKFFKKFNLPSKGGYNRPSRAEIYANRMIPDQFASDIKPNLVGYFIRIDASNRDIEHFVDSINLICSAKISSIINTYLVFLITLRQFEPNLYQKIIEAKDLTSTIAEIMDKFHNPNTHDIEWIAQYLSGERTAELRIGNNRRIHDNFICWENVIGD